MKWKNHARGVFMKLVSYKLKGKPGVYRIGCVIDQNVIDLQEGYRAFLLSKKENDLARNVHLQLPSDPTAFYQMGTSTLERAKAAYHYVTSQADKENLMFALKDVRFGTPIPAPGKIICVGKNYADHVAEMQDGDIPKFPVLFAKFSNALVGPEDAIEKNLATKKLDYEAELAILIGKDASQVSRENAYDYIAGYTIGNDISARDLQKRTPQWLQGKTLDRSTPIGPWVVTADEIDDPCNLSIRSFVNGEKRQDSNTSHFIFDIPFLMAFITDLMTLQPGDIILTGTPDGVGFAMDPPQFLDEGDTVTLEIEEIGKLENRVICK